MKKSFKNRFLALLLGLLIPWSVFGQNARIITGKVIDPEGRPLPGANVVVQGTTTGVQTDIEGNFQMSVPNPENAIIEVSFIGYIPQKINPGNQDSFTITLSEEAVGLNEVVVIGYGTIRKRDLTGSVSSIKTTEITKTATNNALQSMQGRIAGLDITRESGESGSEIKIDLRGNRSLNASNAPLFLVDGIEYGSTLDLNASDIATIDVLKDASSTAIYGTRGANGVIIITTKKGMAGDGKTRIAVNSYVSFNSPTNLPKLMSVQQDYLLIAERQRYNAERGTSAWGTTSLSNYSPETVLSSIVSAPYEKSVYQLYQEGGVNWFDMILRNTVTNNQEISLSGASDKTAFVVSLGYMDENGLMLNDNLKRYNARINLVHNITKSLVTGMKLQFTMRDWDRRDDDIYGQLIKMHSMAQPYLSNGTIIDRPSELAISHTNPLLNEVPGYYVNNTKMNRLFGSIYADWNIFRNLKFRSVLGIDQQSEREGEYKDYMCTENYQFGRGSEFSSLNSETFNYTFENTLNYSIVSGKNDIQLLAGHSAQQDVFESHGASGFGSFDHYLKSSFYDLSFIPTSGRAIENEYTKSNMLSFFGRVNYKFNNRYLLTATLRADGSSVLSAGNQWGYFPSVAAAWVISEESFLDNFEMINNIKLRLSWGKAGNAAIDPYKTLTMLGLDKIPYTFGNQLILGQVPVNLGNPDLTWETTSTWDAGLDFSLLNERISASVDVYYSKTEDLLVYKGLPASSVYPQVLENVGITENRGVEAALSLKIISNKDFSWTSDINFSMNRDKIVSLATGELKDVSIPDNALIVGEPVRAFYNYEADGCWKIEELDQASVYHKIPGDIKIVDQNGDNIIDELDKIVYSKSPKFIFGLNNTITYKNLSLSALVYSRIGQWIQYEYNTAYRPTEADGSPAVDFWTPENQDARFPRPGIASQNDMPALGFEKASFIKIREIMLSYNLPGSMISKVGAGNVRLYGSLQNYFTFSNLDNYDPERGGEIYQILLPNRSYLE